METEEVLRLVREARDMVLAASNVIDFRLDQVDPDKDEREALYQGEADYHTRIGEVGTLWQVGVDLERANAKLLRIERGKVCATS